VDEIDWRHREPLEADYRILCNTTFWEDPASWDPRVYSLDAFTRANVLLSSRALPDAENASVLLPGIDLLNTPADAALSSEVSCVTLEYPSPNEFSIVLQDGVEAGKQIFLRYGSGRPNKVWMLNFGFVMPSNSAERTELDLFRTDELSPSQEGLIRALEGARSITLRLGFLEERISDEVWISLWVSSLPLERAVEELESVGEREEELIRIACEEATRERSVALLRGILQSSLQAQRTSIEEDEAFLTKFWAGPPTEGESPARDLDENMASAVEYRLAKKALVREALRALGGG